MKLLVATHETLAYQVFSLKTCWTWIQQRIHLPKLWGMNFHQVWWSLGRGGPWVSHTLPFPATSGNGWASVTPLIMQEPPHHHLQDFSSESFILELMCTLDRTSKHTLDRNPKLGSTLRASRFTCGSKRCATVCNSLYSFFQCIRNPPIAEGS